MTIAYVLIPEKRLTWDNKPVMVEVEHGAVYYCDTDEAIRRFRAEFPQHSGMDIKTRRLQ